MNQTPQEIDDEEILLRTVHPSMYIFDAKLGRNRPTSSVFPVKKEGTEISVFIKSIVISTGRTPEDVIEGKKFLAGIKVKTVRKENLDIDHDKVDDDAHANIIDKALTRTISECDRIAKRLALAAEWIVPPPESKNIS